MNARLFVLAAMLYLHVLDDYVLQGCLKDLKQKAWWRKQTDDPKYDKDFIPPLICHAFSWSFLTMLPIAVFYWPDPPVSYFTFLAVNTVIHATVDHIKANQFAINLVQDQIMHLAQILSAFCICIVLA